MIRSRTRLALFIAGILVLNSCGRSLDRDEISSTPWKYAGGYYVGDVLYFQSNSRLRLTAKYQLIRGDTLLGVIVVSRRNYFIIESPEKERGKYVRF